MDYLAVGAMFRSENSWLDEWIRYHRAVGAERFYLYNDEQDTRVADRILEPYVRQALVECVHVKEMQGLDHSPTAWRQREVYMDIVRKTRDRTRWLALIDLDEFLLPRKVDDVREVLAPYEKHAALAINWNVFGTSGWIRRPPTQTKHLLRRAPDQWEINQFVKSIVQPRRLASEPFRSVHFFQTPGNATVNEKQEIVTSLKHPVSTETIRINHYMLRSYQDFWEVKARRNRAPESRQCDEEFFLSRDRNEIEDDEIARRFGRFIES